MFLRNTALYWNFIKENLGMKRLHCFPRKNNFLSLFGKIRVEHHFPLICPFWDSLQIIIDFFCGNINVIYNWKNRCIISKKFNVWCQIVRRSFMYIKSSNGPKIDPFDTSALIISQWEFWALSETLWYLLSRKLTKSVSKLLETPIVFNLYIKPSCQTLSKAFDIFKKFGARFQRWKVIERFVNFVHYRQKLIYIWISFPEPWLIGTEQTVFFDKFIERINLSKILLLIGNNDTGR